MIELALSYPGIDYADSKKRVKNFFLNHFRVRKNLVGGTNIALKEAV